MKHQELLRNMSCQRLCKERNPSLCLASMGEEFSLESSIALAHKECRYSYLKELDDKATAERGQLRVNVSGTLN